MLMRLFNTVKTLFFCTSAAILLQACNTGDHQSTTGAPQQQTNVTSVIYNSIFANPTAKALFTNAGAASVDQVPCNVNIYRMNFATMGGSGEPTTSSGVFMQPYGDNEGCSGPRPVLLYAHGTDEDKNYDLSQFIIDPSNPATTEATLLLAVYASQGYAVIAPNYAGYADSTLSYHPYLDEKQQATEMIDALNHVRRYAGILDASFSADLFVSGLSQGGYVAMATHKALEAQGETVNASLPISGPYATLDFLDTIMQGYVNGGANIFAPMYLTALNEANNIYADPNDVYDTAYASIANNIYPQAGGSTGSLPAALFSGNPPTIASSASDVNYLGGGFAQDHLLSNTFRETYVDDITTNGENPSNAIRALVQEADLRNWIPQAPLVMCGANDDPVVYHRNANLMADFWAPYVAGGLVTNLDLDETPAGPFAQIMGAWQQSRDASLITVADIHGQTGAFCGFAGKTFFKTLSSVPVAVPVSVPAAAAFKLL